MPDDYSYKIAVSGWGTPHPDLIADCLRDRFPRNDGFPCRLLVAAVQERLTTGVQAIIEYAWDAEWSVVAVVEQATFTGIVGDLVADGADDVMVAGLGQVDHSIVTELAGALPDSCLIIMSAACEFDPETLNLARLCANAGIPVLDLSEGLIELGEFDLEACEEPAASIPEPTKEEAAQPEETDTPVPAPSPTAEPTTACRTIPANAWTRLCQLHAEMAELLHDSPHEEPPEELPRYREPACAGGDRLMRTEYWDKNSGQWRPRGRGRLKHGTKTRQVPRD